MTSRKGDRGPPHHGLGEEKRAMDTLIFIDTNILLDFYRYPRGSAALSALDHIDKNQGIIITGNQVEMEFKKNRQKVIVESIKEMKGPKWETFKIPVILERSKPAKAIETQKLNIQKQSKALQQRIERALKNPSRNDAVYKTVQRLFRADTPLCLTRKDRIRFEIRRLARKRFMLGYPPRKDSDTSIGDAVNWEWVIHCAKKHNANVVIVSRDSDYGQRYGDESIINDWLLEEFRSRVNRRKSLVLTEKLMGAFKEAAIPVTEEEIEAEDELLASIKATSKTASVDLEALFKQFEKESD